MRADVDTTGEIDAIVNKGLDEPGTISIQVDHESVTHKEFIPSAEQSVKDWIQVVDVNLLGTVLLQKEAPHRGLYHAAITVKDMERSLAFYRDALGLRVIVDIVDTVVSGADTDRAVMEAGATLRMIFLRNQRGGMLELLEWRSPVVKERTPDELRFTLTGIVEICLEVDDMEKLAGALGKKGLRFRYPPFFLGKTKITHLVDPDGVPVELIERTDQRGGKQ